MSNIHPFHVIGMSPGNSYFKDKEVDYLLRAIITKYGQTGILVADVPAISTYIALGYSETRARRDKAIPKGNALKNRVRRIADQIGYKPHQVRIFEWADEIAGNSDYQMQYSKITDLYDNNTVFRQAVHSTTQNLLENSEKTFEDMHIPRYLGASCAKTRMESNFS